MRKNMIVKTGISTIALSGCLLLGTGEIESPFKDISVEAATVTKYTTTANVNLRSTNSTKGKILLTIPKGKAVTYVSKSGNWFKIKYNGKTGWVSSSYIKTTKTTTVTPTTVNAAKTTTTYTTTANLNLRSTNSTKGKVLVTIPKGKAVTYVSKSGSWYKVKYNGKTGWVSSSYIKVTTKTTTTVAKPATTTTAAKTTYTTTANLNLRSTNSTSGKVLLTIPKGKAVTYVSKSGNWFKIKYNGKTGWVSSSYIKTTKTTTVTPTAVNSAKTTTTYTTTANLNLRSTNSTKGKVLVTIPKGKAVTYVSKSGNWYKIKYNGKTGWVSSSYIKVTTKTTTTVAKPATTTTAAKTTYTTTANLNLRSTNSTSGKVLLTIPKGKAVTYVSKSGSWYKVTYNGKTGWVSSSYLKATTAAASSSTANKTTTTNSSTTNKTTTATTNTSTTSKPTTTTNSSTSTTNKIYYTNAYLNLRDAASTSGKVLLIIPLGKDVTYIETSKDGAWYKIKYSGTTGWVSKNYLTTSKPSTTQNTTTNTNTSTNNNSSTPVNTSQTITSSEVLTTNSLTLRASASASAASLGTIPANTKLTPFSSTSGWYKVSYNGKTGYVSGNYLINKATKDRINRLESNKNSYVFMDLRTQSSVTAAQIDAYINSVVKDGNSVLKGTGKYFVAAGNKYGVNALYLAAHAIHESNFGRSSISLDRYNLFGYGAYDIVPYLGAVKFPSIENNIHFIAQKIKATYLGNSYLNQGTFLGYSVKSVTGVRVDSLSKGMNFYYATDPQWGESIGKHMEKMLAYANEGAKNKAPNTVIPANPAYPDGVDVFPANTLAVSRSAITLYNSKSTASSVGTIPKGAQFNLLEKDNNYWLKVRYDDEMYYAQVPFSNYKAYFTVKNLGRVTVSTGAINFRSAPNIPSTNPNSNVIGTLKHKQFVELVLDKNQVPIQSNGFYKVKADGKEGWASGAYIVRELNK